MGVRNACKGGKRKRERTRRGERERMEKMALTDVDKDVQLVEDFRVSRADDLGVLERLCETEHVACESFIAVEAEGVEGGGGQDVRLGQHERNERDKDTPRKTTRNGEDTYVPLWVPIVGPDISENVK